MFSVFVCRSGGWRQWNRSTGFFCKSFSKDHPTVSPHTCTRIPPSSPSLPIYIPHCSLFLHFPLAAPLFPQSLSLAHSHSLSLSVSLVLSCLSLTHKHTHTLAFAFQPNGQILPSLPTISCMFSKVVPIFQLQLFFFSLLGVFTHGRTGWSFSASPSFGNS